MADEVQPKGGDDKIGGIRGPAYPYVNLERAVEKASAIAEKGAARQKMPPETFYKLWGMGAKSSSSRQTMRSEEHTSELQSLMRISYAVFCLKKKNKKTHIPNITLHNTMTHSLHNKRH